MAIYGQADTQILGGGVGGFGGFGGGYGYPVPYPIPTGGCGYGGGYGGGYGCGFGGWGEALVLAALVGGGNGFFGNRNNCCCDKDNNHFHFDGHHNGHDCHNGHHTEEVILDDAHYNSLQNSISGVKDNITALGTNIGDKFALTNSLISDVKFQSALNTKDIIHDIDIQSCNLGSKIDKCCCETNHNVDNKFFALSKQLSDCCCEIEKQGLKNTQVILDKLNTTEIQELRDRLCRCEKDKDNFQLINSIIAGFRQNAATVGSNFNTGTQTQSTSNNSGQQIGA